MNYLQEISTYLTEFNPAYSLILAGLLVYKLPDFLFKIIVLILPILVTLTFSWHYNFQTIIIFFFLIALFLTTLYGVGFKNHYKKEISISFFHAGAALGVITAENLFNFFINWELMSIGAFILMLNPKNPDSYPASLRYILLHIIGGTILLTGIAIYIRIAGSSSIPHFIITWQNFKNLFTDMQSSNFAGCLILIAVLINAAIPPFSAWLADSYAKASPLASIFLSIFTTKTAIFTLLNMFAGSSILISIGIFTIFYGIIYSLLENNLRKLLSYNMISQIGFLTVAIGVGSISALTGTIIQLSSHIIYNLLLFMVIGVIISVTKENKISALAGLLKFSKTTFIFLLIASLTMSSFPFTMGFIGKSIIAEAVYDYSLAIWLILLISSAAIIIPIIILQFSWLRGLQTNNKKYNFTLPSSTLLAMVLTALLCILPGLYPAIFLNYINPSLDFELLETSRIIKQLQLLLCAILAGIISLPLLKRTETISLDFDWFYRIICYKIFIILYLSYEFVVNFCLAIKDNTNNFLQNILSKNLGPQGNYTLRISTNVCLTYFIVLLTIFILFAILI